MGFGGIYRVSEPCFEFISSCKNCPPPPPKKYWCSVSVAMKLLITINTSWCLLAVELCVVGRSWFYYDFLSSDKQCCVEMYSSSFIDCGVRILRRNDYVCFCSTYLISRVSGVSMLAVYIIDVVLSSHVFFLQETTFIHSFISGIHHYECVVSNVDINLQSGRFWATLVASFRERFIDFRSCWVVFIHMVRGRPGGLLQFSKGEAVKICLASDSSGICTMWPNEKE